MTDKKQGGAVVSSLSDKRGQKTAWLQLSASRHDELAAAQAKLGLDLSVKRGRAAAEEAGFILIPVEMVIRQGQQYRETSLL
ncbi:magnesium transporter, partial [Alcaligenes pakistanensis]